jgi:hypothetical protein
MGNAMGVMVFEPDSVGDVLAKLGFEINPRGFVEKGRKQVKCASCGVPIKTKNFGSVLPKRNSQPAIYCDESTCIIHYIQENVYK